MQEEFVKEKKIIDKSKDELNTVLVQSIIKTNSELHNARNNYEYAEGELIDYYLYQIKANQAKLNYLIKQSKTNGITIDRLKQIEIKNMEKDNAV